MSLTIAGCITSQKPDSNTLLQKAATVTQKIKSKFRTGLPSALQHNGCWFSAMEDISPPHTDYGIVKVILVASRRSKESKVKRFGCEVMNFSIKQREVMLHCVDNPSTLPHTFDPGSP